MSAFDHDVLLYHILEDAITLCCDLLLYGIPIETLVACIGRFPVGILVWTPAVVTEAICSPPLFLQ